MYGINTEKDVTKFKIDEGKGKYGKWNLLLL